MKYDSKQIGEQIAKRRKELGLTQEDLAAMLSVTPQAISKWERGGGLPDISLLPDIAVSLGLTMDELFGQTKSGPEEIHYLFPEEYKGLKFVLSYQDLACYSDLEVQNKSEIFVSFVGGSTANLGTGELNFKGAGQIELVSADTFFEQYKKEYADQGISVLGQALSEISGSIVEGVSNLAEEILGEPVAEEGEFATERTQPNFEGIDCLRVESSGSLDFEISPNAEGIFRWGAPSLTDLQDRLEVFREGNSLVFRYQAVQDWSFFKFDFWKKHTDKLRIELPRAQLRRLELQIRGSSDVKSQVSFAESSLHITGAGDVEALDLGASDIRVSGAGDIKVHHLGPAKIAVSGAGDIDIDEVSDKLEVSLNGAGDVSIGQGQLQHLALNMTGAGDFRGRNLTTETAEITMSGMGEAVIGHIKGQSRERVGRISRLKVLQRG